MGCSSDGDSDGGDSGGGDTGGASGTGGTASGGSAGTMATGGTSAAGSSGAGAIAGSSSGGTSATGGTGASGASGAAGTGGGAGGGSSDCDGVCQKLLGAACNTITQAECVADCDALSAACPAETPPYLACVVNPASTIMCQDMSPAITGCDEPINAVAVCAVCVPSSEDTACGTCTRGSCCTVLQDYVTASDVDGFDPCVAECADQACVDACAAQFPAAGAAYEELADCQFGSCGEPCVCQASADDLACVACAKQNCCAELVPYTSAPDVADFAACIEPCADQDCLDGCIVDYPEAGTAYNELLGCLEGPCFDDCVQ